MRDELAARTGGGGGGRTCTGRSPDRPFASQAVIQIHRQKLVRKERREQGPWVPGPQTP